MKVILLQDVKGLGRRHDIKDASDGYTRNFLIPKGLVEIATPQAISRIERLKAHLVKEDTELTKLLEDTAQKLKNSFLEFKVKTDESGSVFGSVTKEMILKAMREHDWLGNARVEVELDHPLKKLGEHRVQVGLKKGITAELKVVLRPQE